jgi:hypothetical protein
MDHGGDLIGEVHPVTGRVDRGFQAPADPGRVPGGLLRTLSLAELRVAAVLPPPGCGPRKLRPIVRRSLASFLRMSRFKLWVDEIGNIDANCFGKPLECLASGVWLAGFDCTDVLLRNAGDFCDSGLGQTLGLTGRPEISPDDRSQSFGRVRCLCGLVHLGWYPRNSVWYQSARQHYNPRLLSGINVKALIRVNSPVVPNRRSAKQADLRAESAPYSIGQTRSRRRGRCSTSSGCRVPHRRGTRRPTAAQSKFKPSTPAGSRRRLPSPV